MMSPLRRPRRPRGGNSLIAQGRHIFRFETFGDEAKWTDTLRLHEVIAAAVDPTTALSVGLKVDADALPQSVKDGILNGSVDLKSPQTTLVLLELDAVIGLKGKVDKENNVLKLKSVGTTCALCHSTVDNSFASRHRQAARRLAEPRSERRHDHRVVAGGPSGRERAA